MALFNKKKPAEAITPFKKYDMTLTFIGDPKLSYEFTNVLAENADDAIKDMKRYVADHGFFDGMDKETVISMLTVTEIKEI